MMQIRLRHFMVFVLYVAVVLFLLVKAWKDVQSHRVGALNAIVLIPFALAGLSVLVLRPGPHRDRTLALIFAVSMATLYVPPLLFLIVFAVKGRPLPPSIGEAWRKPLDIALYLSGLVVAVIALIYGAFLLSAMFLVGRRFLIPRRCPCCQRKELVPTIRAAIDRNPRRSWHLRCGTCDRDFLMRIPASPQLCPNCGRNTLYVRRYKFSWCLKCRGRFKRLPRGVWEDASLPQEDGYYFVWSFGGWLHTLCKRAFGTVRSIS
jgi:hypothetical protein